MPPSASQTVFSWGGEVAPVRSDPGGRCCFAPRYGPHLDRDNAGIGCE
ncbi:excalibur calcium-binding domain-containing protein [Parasphingopyxis sp.]